jgi:hypothetical protein
MTHVFAGASSSALLFAAAFASSFVVGCSGRGGGFVGCGNDSDCKFDRICVDYVCVDPEPSDGSDSTESGADTAWSTTQSDPTEDGSTSWDDGSMDDGLDPDLPSQVECLIAGMPVGTGETFLFTHAYMGSTGIVYLLDDDYRLVRRYDIATDAFLQPWEIDLGATALAVSPDGADVYVGYDGGRIDHFDAESGTKQFLAALAEEVLSMAVADDWLFTIDPSGAWESHSLIRRSDGVLTATADWRSSSHEIAYAPLLRRVFTLRDGTSPNDIIMTDVDVMNGLLSADQDSPYHGDYAVGHPLRIFPDETRIIVSSGVIFSTNDLSYVGSLGLDYLDLGFFEDQIFLIDVIGNQAQLTQLDQDFSIVATEAFYLAPEKLFIHHGTLVLFVRCDGELGIYRRAL